MVASMATCSSGSYKMGNRVCVSSLRGRVCSSARLAALSSCATLRQVTVYSLLASGAKRDN